MPAPIRKTRFVPEWIDMRPRIPVPRIDWIGEKRLDTPYGEDPLQRYDLYYPPIKKEPYPTIILVHGGGFVHCDKRDWHVYPGFHALQTGFALVSVNYRLAPAAPFPSAVEDLKTVIGILRKNADELRLDTNNFFLYGTSAGGNLVSYAGLDGAASLGKEDDYHVNAVAVLCPLINFNTYFSQVPWFFRLVPPLRKMAKGYLGEMPEKLPERAREASADSRITKYAPAFYIQHGDRDPVVNLWQSVDFYEKLKSDGGLGEEDLILDIIKGAPHAGAGPEYLEIGHVKPILDFFERHKNHAVKT